MTITVVSQAARRYLEAVAPFAANDAVERAVSCHGLREPLRRPPYFDCSAAGLAAGLAPDSAWRRTKCCKAASSSSLNSG